eukprot:11260037-Karenia_brevis.AAC.1
MVVRTQPEHTANFQSSPVATWARCYQDQLAIHVVTWGYKDLLIRCQVGRAYAFRGIQWIERRRPHPRNGQQTPDGVYVAK